MKIFISHSSVDKPYATQLIEEIGRDQVTFDTYSFQPGESLTDNIIKSIEECDIFLLLLSQKSISSPWVIEEINTVAPLITTKGIDFKPFLIDETVKFNDDRLPSWVWKILIKYYPYPKLLARTIQRIIRSHLWKKYPEIRQQADLFVGRNNDMGKLEKKFYNENLATLKAIFISGFPFVGRKTCLTKFINRYIKRDFDEYTPIIISLESTNSLEQLVLQLNEHVGLTTHEKLLLELSEGKDKTLEWCFKLLKEVIAYQEKIIIDDDACIVKPGGGIEEWFLDIVKNSKLPSIVIFFIASRYRPNVSFVEQSREIMEMPLYTLQRDDMYILFKACLEIRGKRLNDDDMTEFVDSFTGYPKQAIDLSNIIASNSIIVSKQRAKTLNASYDGNYSIVINNLSNGAKDMLILLSKFDFISCDFLQEIYEDKDISKELDELNSYSLYEIFGLSQQYISLNHSVADYIVRTRRQLSNELKTRLRIVAKRILSETQSELTDLSSSLFNIKENIRNNINRIDERYLIPSFALKVIVEEYHANDDRDVITIANKLIRDYNKVNYSSCIDAIHYWLCCSLCRLQSRDDFNREIEYFRDKPFDYYFLHGFYNRHHNKPSKLIAAKDYYEQAMDSKNERMFSLTSVAKVEHELVIVLMKLREYGKALKLAKRNYDNNPHNTYHIRAYFNCLCETSNSDKQEMESLITAMRATKERGVAVFVPTMEIQYQYYCDRDFISAVKKFRNLLSEGNRFGTKYPINVLKELCHNHDAMAIYNDIIKKNSINDQDEDDDNYDV